MSRRITWVASAGVVVPEALGVDRGGGQGDQLSREQDADLDAVADAEVAEVGGAVTIDVGEVEARARRRDGDRTPGERPAAATAVVGLRDPHRHGPGRHVHARDRAAQVEDLGRLRAVAGGSGTVAAVIVGGGSAALGVSGSGRAVVVVRVAALALGRAVILALGGGGGGRRLVVLAVARERDSGGQEEKAHAGGRRGGDDGLHGVLLATGLPRRGPLLCAPASRRVCPRPPSVATR